jgi:hypothetical protein
MRASEYEYYSDFAKGYVAQGKREGQVEGRAQLVTRLLTLRFGELSADERGKISKASIAELDRIGERLLTSATLQEALAEV